MIADSLQLTEHKEWAHQTAGHNLLVVDDNRAVHQDIERVLLGRQGNFELEALEAELFSQPPLGRERAQFHLHFAAQGQEGVEIIRRLLDEEQNVSVAFVDMRMPPGWDGVETIERIWQYDPDVQVVICTSYSDHSWLEIIKRLPRPDQLLILKKPIDPVEVLQATAALTHKWVLQRIAQDRVENLNRLVRERTRESAKANEELRRKLEEIQRMETELRLAQRLEAIGQLAAGIAHEINTPAQFVADNLTFLGESCTELLPLLRALHEQIATSAPQNCTLKSKDLEFLLKEIPRAIEQSREGMDRVANIVRAMRSFSHPGETHRKLANINDAVKNTVTVSRNEWKYAATLETDLDAQLPLVWCFPGEINQVLLNLLVNASHAIQEKSTGQDGDLGKIRIATRVVEDFVEISVSDTGTGIPEAIHGRIFDPFFTTKEVGKGTGQGLALTHNIVVKRHGGGIHFETGPDQGTTFYVRLPLSTGEGP